jgi:hypothetical protein
MHVSAGLTTMVETSKRSPPRLNATSAVLRHAAKFGFDVHVLTKPDGTVVYDLRRSKADAPVEADDGDALTGDAAHAHIRKAIAKIGERGRGGRTKDD